MEAIAREDWDLRPAVGTAGVRMADDGDRGVKAGALSRGCEGDCYNFTRPCHVPRVRWTPVTRPAARVGTARRSSRGTTPTTSSATSDLAAEETFV